MFKTCKKTNERIARVAIAFLVINCCFAFASATAQPQAPNNASKAPSSDAVKSETNFPSRENLAPEDWREEKRNFWRDKMGRRMGHEGVGGPGAEGYRAGKLKKFLQFMSTYHESVKDPINALGLSVLSIKQEMKKQGKVQEAAVQFEKDLEGTENQEARNILLFAIRQIAEESGDTAKVMELNQRILKENLAELDK